MRYIKQYKIFESSIDDFAQEVKECFLPVIDIVTEDNLKIYIIGESHVILKSYISNDENLFNEIIDSIYHLKAYDIKIFFVKIYYVIKWAAHIYRYYTNENKTFHESEKLEEEVDDFFKNCNDSISRIEISMHK